MGRDVEMKMREKQWKVFNYLKSKYPEWVSPTQVGREVAGWPNHSSWGSPVCKSLVEAGVVERNEKGHYRYIIEGEEK